MLTSTLWVIEASERQVVLFGDGNPSGTLARRKAEECWDLRLGVGLKYWGSLAQKKL
jgi:hypothetical protein